MRKKSKTAYHHGDLRNELLRAAEDMLPEQGVNGLSLRAVAKQAGVSHAAPYRHFADKTELLTCLAEQGFERLWLAMVQAQQTHPDDPVRQLKAAGMEYVRLAVRHPEITSLMFGGFLPKKSAPESMLQRADTAFQRLLDIIDQGKKQGFYKEYQTMDLALAAWSMVHGLSMLFTAGRLIDVGTTDDLEHTVDRLSDILLSGMLK